MPILSFILCLSYSEGDFSDFLRWWRHDSTLSSDPLDYAEIFDKIVPHADLEASGYEMKIIQTSDFDRPLDDFFMVFQHVRNFQLRWYFSKFQV